ncbi:uncharacterized protein LOC122052063 [Zingiber officinale]|uniref:uncharacterized protein LOC122052063 n=1 Tax=Zingiber officinale TaxID=94328 RepID=UPI001C4C08FB|nr:uncharacterized protein LOC122052063 [Zingiber officinale]
MGGPDCAGYDRTFKVSFSQDGLSRLHAKVMEKLKEFMGDYTDGTLVDYVVVLLRNGRSKDEARKELNVFLGDDSDTFISWLWDHLSSNIHLYTQPNQSIPDEVAKSKPISCVLSERQNSQEDQKVTAQTDTNTRNSHGRGWKGKTKDNNGAFPLRSVVTNILHAEEEVSRQNVVGQSHSPTARIQRKRSRDDEHPQRYTASYPVIGAPRRLLQFAVRDAVKAVQQSSSRVEPASKRLCSVISTCTTNSLLEAKFHRKSELRAPGTLSIALKAAAEAAEDVTRVRPVGSVFNRLGHDEKMEESVNRLPVTTGLDLEDGEYDPIDKVSEPLYLDHHYRNEYANFDDNMTILEKETDVADDFVLDNNECDGVVDVSHLSQPDQDSLLGTSSSNRDVKSMIMQPHAVAEEISNKRLLEQEHGTGPLALTSKKIMSTSANETHKHIHYLVASDDPKVENQVAARNSEGAGSQNVNFLKDNDVFSSQNMTETKHADQRQSTQKQLLVPGSYVTGRPLDDGDSRTLFVSNVHFAATKDTLSRHFNKFGDVLKVIIITDATTGQPTGSAYVEFLKKESADSALSLNGTSFMSRILKVVRRSSYEAAPVLPWPRMAHAPPFPSRLGRRPYPRGLLLSTFRGRLPIKPGARSLQWKRGTSTVPSGSGEDAKPSQTSDVQSPTARSLTYVRTAPKPAAGLSGSN